MPGAVCDSADTGYAYEHGGEDQVKVLYGTECTVMKSFVWLGIGLSEGLNEKAW